MLNRTSVDKAESADHLSAEQLWAPGSAFVPSAILPLDTVFSLSNEPKQIETDSATPSRISSPFSDDTSSGLSSSAASTLGESPVVTTACSRSCSVSPAATDPVSTLAAGAITHCSSSCTHYRPRRLYKSDEQVRILKQCYLFQRRPSPKALRNLVERTHLSETEIRTWFRNQRYRNEKSPKIQRVSDRYQCSEEATTNAPCATARLAEPTFSAVCLDSAAAAATAASDSTVDESPFNHPHNPSPSMSNPIVPQMTYPIPVVRPSPIYPPARSLPPPLNDPIVPQMTYPIPVIRPFPISTRR